MLQSACASRMAGIVVTPSEAIVEFVPIGKRRSLSAERPSLALLSKNALVNHLKA
jgi:hypothetical protein